MYGTTSFHLTMPLCIVNSVVVTVLMSNRNLSTISTIGLIRSHPTSNFQRNIHEAIFHYSARIEVGDRFQVCISTRDMEKAAWAYTHHSQVVFDGTFGVCSSRLLLFITLVKDENGKGIPIAFFLFSAPSGNRATHAGYNTQVLFELLSLWKKHLSRNSKEPFTPYVAITDTDTKERGALVRVWPDIHLLLCKFHLRQCWTNHRKTIVRGKGPDFWKDHIKNNLYKLESQCVKPVQIFNQRISYWGLSRLITMSDHATSLQLISTYEASFNQLLANSESARAASRASPQPPPPAGFPGCAFVM